jgi:hypothetical protein
VRLYCCPVPLFAIAARRHYSALGTHQIAETAGIAPAGVLIGAVGAAHLQVFPDTPHHFLAR